MPQHLQPSKRLILPVVLFALSLFSLNAAAAVIITKGTGGNLCVGSGYSPLTNIVITENLVGDFTASGTLILNTSANFEFNTAFLPGVSVTGTGISTTGGSFGSSTSLTINFTLFGGHAGVINSITISGLEVRAITAATLGGRISRAGTFGLTGVVAGVTSFADLNSYATPTTSVAGPNLNNCNNGNFTMAANAPGVGSGLWTLISGAAGITSSGSPTTGITGVPVGTSATLRWTISNGACTPSTDDVTLTNYALATVSNAGPDINQCNNGTFTMAGNVPGSGAGLWSVFSGAATIISPSANNSSVIGVPVSTSATLRWTITNGSCSSFNDVILTNNPNPTPAVSGLNSVCAGTAGLVYTTALVAGHTYLWSITGGAITSGGATNSATVTWGAAGPGTLTVAETITATGCSVTTGNYNVTINANPAPSITVGTPTVCTGATGVVYSTANVGGHTYVWTIGGGAITAGAGTNSVTVTWGAAGAGTLTVAETITATGCAATSPVYNVLINPKPAPSIGGLNSVCAGTAGLIYSTTLVAGHTYLWSITGGSITAGGATNSATVTWGVAGPGTLTVAETITATGCSLTTGNFNVTINANPAPSITVGTPTVCAGATGIVYSTANIGGHSYAWTISGGAITAGAGTNSVTATWGAAGAGTLTVTETITATGCVVTSPVYNVLINPNPTPSISGLNSACAGSTGVNYTTALVAGHTYLWSITGGSITSGGATNSATVSWGVAGPGTLTVAETITATGCSVTTGNYNVTINANPAPSITVGTPTVCAGATGVIYSTASVGGHSYAWTISGGTITAGAGTNSVTVTWGAAGAGTLTVLETITASGCAATSPVYNVLINPNPTPSIGGSNSVCAGTAGLTYSTTSIAGHTYSWAITGGSITSGGATNSATVTWGVAGAGTLTVAETITATGCSVTTGNYNVNINANPAPSITVGTPTVCAGAAGVVYSTANVGGHGYLWSIGGGTITAGAGTNSITVTWGAAGAGTLTVTESIISSGCSVVSPAYNVVINPNPAPIISGLNSVCAGTAGVVYTTTLVAGHTYLWSITGGSITSGGLTNSATITWGGVGTGTLTVAETITASGCSVTTGNYNVSIISSPSPLITVGTPTVCAGASGIVYSTANVGGHSYVWAISGGSISAGAGTNSITVNWGAGGAGTLSVTETVTATGCATTSPVYNVLINSNPAPSISGLNTVCAGTAGVVYTTGLVAGHTYLWSITGGAITSGGATNSATVTWGGVGTGTLTVAETITATGCSATTGNYNVSIITSPTPLITVGTPTVCAGASGVVYSTANVAGHSYVWAITGGSITAGGGTNSITVTWGSGGAGTLAVTESVTVTGCATTSPVYNVTINPNPTPFISGLNTVCENAMGISYSTPAVAGNSYAWLIIGGSITSGSGTNAITVTWGSAGSGTLRISETVTASGCSVITPNYNVTINFSPTPAIVGPTPVCSGSSGAVYGTVNVPGDSYIWTISGGTITAGAGTSSIAVDWGAAGLGNIGLTESVISTGCSANAVNYPVTINPPPTPGIIGLNAVCENTAGVNYSTPAVAGHTYLWTISGGSIASGAGSNAIMVDWGPAGTGILTVAETITATGCAVTTPNFNVNIVPGPTPSITVGTPTVCAGAVGVVYSTANVGGHTYVWTISGGIITAGAGTNSIIVTWGGAGAGSLSVTETVAATGCSITTPLYNVLINPNPTPIISGLNSVCAGATGIIYATNFVAGHTYVWSISGGLIAGGVGTNSVTVDWAGSGTGTLTVAETITATGCSVTTGNYNVTINANPTPAIAGLTTVCSGVTGIVYSTSSVGGHTYIWTISGGVVTAGAGTSSVTVTWGAAGIGALTVAEKITATGCVVTTGNYDVTINPLPTPGISGLNTVCENMNGVAYNTPGIGGHTYLWTISGGSIAGGAGTNAITVNWGPAGTGTLTVAETITATGCAVTTGNYSVTINANPAPVISGLSPVCSGTAGVVYSTPNVVGHAYVWTIAGGAITAGAGTNSITVTWGASGIGTLTVAETITSTGCVVTTGNFNVTINANPTPLISGLNTVCENINGVAYSTPGIGGHTYLWTISGGSIAGGAGTNAITVNWGPAGTGTLTVAETIIATGCAVTTGNYSVTINANPAPVISGLSPVCSGTAGVVYSTPNVVGHAYVWTIAGGAITAGAGTNNITVTWGASGIGTLTVAETITSTGCVVTTGNFNVTINANPTPLISGLNTVCENINGVAYSTPGIGGHTYLWTISGGSIASGAGTNAITVNWGPAGTGTLTVAETIIATGCAVTTGNYSVTINANPAPVISGLTPVCSGVSGIVYSTPIVGGHTYVWTISGGTITAGAGTNSVTVTWGGAGTGTLSVAETIIATGCVVTTTPYNVLINPVPTFTITNNTGGGSGAICSGNQTNITLTSPTPGATITLQNVSYGPVTGGLYSGGGTFATGANIVESPGGLINPTNTPAAVIYIFTVATGSCSNPVTQQTTVTVNPTPGMSISNTTPAICSGNAVNITLTSPTAGAVITLNTITYGAVAGTLIAPRTYTPGSIISESLTNGTNNPVTVTYSFSVSANGCSTAGPFDAVVTVNPIPTAQALPLNSTICDGQQTNITLSNPNNVLGGVTYNWTVSVVSGNVSGQANGPGASPIIQTLTTDNVGGIVRYSIQATSISGSCLGPPVNADVRVNPVPTASVNVASTATLCSGATTNILIQNPNSVSGTTFSWTSALQSGTVGGHSAGSGALIAQALTTNSTGGVVRYTITPVANGCSGTSIVWDVTVNPVPVGVNIVEPVICSNFAFSYDPQLEITNGVVSTFNWTALYDAGLTGGAPSGSGPVTGSLSNLTGGVLKVVFTVTPTAPGPGSCVGNTFTITVPVNPQPVGTTLTLTPVCSDVAFSFNPQAEVSNGVASSFSWTAVIDPLLSGGATSGAGPLTGTITNDTGTTRNAVFTVTPTSASGCLGVNFTLTVPILSEPKGADATAAAICSDASVNYNLQTNVNALGNAVSSNFTWVATSNAGIGGESTSPQSGPVINDLLSNTTGGSLTVTYTVTPTSVSGCVGNNFTISVPVNSKPVGTNFTEPAVCSGVAFSFDPQAHVTNLMTSTFTWNASYASGLTGGTGNGTGLIAETLINQTSTPANAVYTVTPTSGGCVGSTFNITVQVSPQPIGQPQNVTICSKTPVGITMGTTAPSVAASTYTITGITFPPALTAGGGNATTGPGRLANAIFNDQFTNLTSGSLIVTYTVMPVSAAGCVGSSFTLTATINPEPVGVNQSVSTCSDVSSNYNLISNVALLGNNVGSTFTWSAAPNPNVTGESTTIQSGPAITDNLNNVTLIDRMVSYTVTPTGANGCSGATFQIDIVVHPEPVGTTLVAPTVLTTICSGSLVNYNLQTNVNGNNSIPSTFTWTAGLNPNITGESGSLQTTTVINDILTNTDPAFNPQAIVYTIQPVGSTYGCVGNPFNVSITVNPRAVVSAGPDLAVCANVPSQQLQGSITYSPGAVSWSGGAGSFSPSNSVITPDYTYTSGEVGTQVTFTLTAPDPDGSGPCASASDVMNLKVNPLPIVAFFGILPPGSPPQIPQNHPTETLSAIQGGGQFSINPGVGLGTTFIGSDFVDHVIFDPSAATLGIDTIRYAYTDANGCSNTAIQFVQINPVTTITFDVDGAGPPNANDEFDLCGNQGLIHLTGHPAPSSPQAFPGSTYTQFRFVLNPLSPAQTLPVVSKIGGEYYFQSNGVASDTYIIEYDFENVFNAQTSKQMNLNIFASPIAGISVANSCITQAINFTDVSTLPPPSGSPVAPPSSPIVAWEWNFADGSALDPSQNPSHDYLPAGPGLYNVTLRVTTGQNCSSSVIKQIRVGDFLVPQFIWSAVCSNDSTKFKDQTPPGTLSTIKTYTWDFGDGDIISGDNGQTIPFGTNSFRTSGKFANPNHAYGTIGNKNAKLTILTDDGCINSVLKTVDILPFTSVTPGGTFEDFEGPVAGGGWSPDSIAGTSGESWIWTTPNGTAINSASSGNYAWWTGLNSATYLDGSAYLKSEQSVVNGPCYDLSQLQRPMISFDYWVDTQKDFDGAVLQYSIDAGNTWVDIGVPLEGINWFTKEQIVSNPGGQVGFGPYGWTGQSGKWLNARANLDTIPISGPGCAGNCRKQVRIRIAFSSDAHNAFADRLDGFAFDNVFVGEKRRNVLVEHFTNAGQQASIFADAYLDKLHADWVALRGVADFQDIRYHLSNPNQDPLNLNNTADPGARALFLGVTEPPFTVMDGRLDAVFTGYTNGITPEEVDRRALKDPKFDLALTSSIGSASNKLNVQLVITADTTFSANTQLIAQVVLLENSVGGFTNVVRKHLLGTGGESIKQSWTGPAPPIPGQQLTITKSDIEINVPIVTSTNNLTLVAYIQDKDSKEIYQSLVIPAPNVQGGPITGIDEPVTPSSMDEIALFPNPANDHFKFSLPDNLPPEYTWNIADQRGITVLTGDFEGAVNRQKSVDVSSLANGVYFVIIGAPAKPSVYRKLVIMNNH